MQSKKIIIRKHPQTGTTRLASSSDYLSTESPASQEQDNSRFCFFLGLAFGPFGLLLAAIVGKVEGLKKAIKGFIVMAVIATIIWFVLEHKRGSSYSTTTYYRYY